MRQKNMLMLVILYLTLIFGSMFVYLRDSTDSSSSTEAGQTNSVFSVNDTDIIYNANSWTEYESLTIPHLREQNYPGSKINIQKTAYSGSNYTAYIADYQSEGLNINGLLTVPNDAQDPNSTEKYRAVVFIHGYIPPNQYVTTEKYNAYVDYLASNNIVVFKIDLRGHGNSEGYATGAYYSSDYIIDTINAIESLKQLDYVEKEKVGLWGHSMAGNIVLRAMAVKPDIYAGVIWAGAVYTYADMQEYGINDASYRRNRNLPEDVQNKRQNLRNSVGEVTENSEFWNLVKPTNYLEDFQGSVQVHHAINDDVVSINYTRDLKVLLDKSNVTNEVYEYLTGGHNINSPSFEIAMKRTVDFFKLQ